MSKTSSGVIVTRIVLAVILLSLIFTCIYFFIIRAREDAKITDNEIFASYNATLNSADMIEIKKNLGALESGGYFAYAESQGGLGYKEAYLGYYASSQVLDAYSFRLISSRGNTSNINSALNALNAQAVVLLRSQVVYNTSREAYGDTPNEEQRNALFKNFNVIVKDLKAFGNCMYDLAHEVFAYTSNSYYEGYDSFRSAQYVYGYCMDKQLHLLNEAVQIDVTNVNNILYTESKLMTNKFIEVKDNHFVAQTTDETVGSMVSYFTDEANNHFDTLLAAKDKADFVGKIVNETQKNKSTQVLIALGLGGRL